MIFRWVLCGSLLVFTACISLPAQNSRTPASAIETEAFFVQDPQTALRVRWDLIDKEDQEIFAQFHLWDSTGVGRYSLIKLCAKAQAGIKVRLVVDGLGMMWPSVFTDASLIQVLQERCVSTNGQRMEIRFWNPIDSHNFLNILKGKNLHRSHDKILYLGGQEIVYEGDRNWQNLNFREDPLHKGYSFISTDAVISGAPTAEVKAYLEDVWKVATSAIPKEVTKAEKAYTVRTDVGTDRIEYAPLKYYEYYHEAYVSDQNDFDSKMAEIRMPDTEVPSTDWRSAMKSVGVVHFIHFDPAQRLSHDDSMTQELLTLLNSAQTKILISTPFLRMSDEIFDTIKRLRERGIAVELVTGKASSLLIQHFYQFQNRDIDRLRKLGVKIYQTIGTDDLHMKTIVVDDHAVFLGTHNFNMRSTYLDLESGFIFDNPDVAQVMTQFLKSQIEDYKERKSLSYILLTPIMKPLLKWPFLQRQF